MIKTFWQPIGWHEGLCTWWRNCITEAEAIEAIQLRDQVELARSEEERDP